MSENVGEQVEEMGLENVIEGLLLKKMMVAGMRVLLYVPS